MILYVPHVVVVVPAVLSWLLKVYWPDLPFMDRVGLVFLLCVAVGVVWSTLRPRAQAGFVDPAGVSFSTTQGFNVSAVVVTLILIFFYTVWW